MDAQQTNLTRKLRTLSLGTTLVLLAGPTVLLGLFSTWQQLSVEYGPAYVTELPQDGWDAWGLAAGVLSLTIVTIVVLRRLTGVEMSADVPWETVTFGLGVLSFALVVLKSLTDDDSTLTSYVFVAAAGLLAAGTYLGWAETRGGGTSLRRRKRRAEVRPTA